MRILTNAAIVLALASAVGLVAFAVLLAINAQEVTRGLEEFRGVIEGLGRQP